MPRARPAPAPSRRSAPAAHPSRAPSTVTDAQILSTLRALALARAPKSICPSEVARALAPEDFRPLMPRIRALAAKLVTRGDVRVTQRGIEVDPVTARGPIRITATPDS